MVEAARAPAPDLPGLSCFPLHSRQLLTGARTWIALGPDSHVHILEASYGLGFSFGSENSIYLNIENWTPRFGRAVAWSMLARGQLELSRERDGRGASRFSMEMGLWHFLSLLIYRKMPSHGILARRNPL